MVMKRLTAPNFWPVERKSTKYIIDPKAGPHSKRMSIPVSIILRDVLKYALTTKEARKILNSGQVKVDGVARKDYAFPAGIMDVISVGEENYRMLPAKHGLRLAAIDKKDAGVKLSRIEGKTCVRGGKVQLHMHDGKNILLDKDAYKTSDVLVIDIVTKKVKDALKVEKGSKVLVIGGSNMGSVGTVEDIIITKSSMPNKVIVNLGEKTIDLSKNYVFAIGKNEPVIKI